MEKGEDTTIVLRKDRGYAGCLHQGLSIVTHKFNLLWKFMWPLLLLITIVNMALGWIAFSHPFSETLFFSSIFINAVMAVYYMAMVSVLIRKLDELGYIPSVRAWVLGRSTIRRSLRSCLVVIVALFVTLFAFYGYTILTPTTGHIPMYYEYIKLAILVVLIIFSVLFGMFTTDYMIGDDNLIGTCRNLRSNLKYVGHYLAVAVVAGIIVSLCIGIGALPQLLTTHVTEAAAIGRLEGDIVTLPTYYPILCVVARGLCALITSISFLLMAFPLAFYWGKLNEEEEYEEEE